MPLYNISANMENQKDCLDIAIDSAGSLMVKILNVHGEFIKTIKHSFQSNAEMVSVALDDLSTGNYVLNIFKDNSFIQSFYYNKF